jgi:hypothetical protein
VTIAPKTAPEKGALDRPPKRAAEGGAVTAVTEVTPRPSPRLVRPAAAPPDIPQLTFRRGRRFPRAIAWFGARSFWGHLWHLAASVAATEDIDSRRWMHADDAGDFTRNVAELLGAPNVAASLTEALDSDLWIDFIADTGDCSAVSGAVARMLFQDYEVDDPEDPQRTLVLERGHLLLFGGDTAYPVATELEIHNRVIVPFNQVLRGRPDAKNRVLLGVPGNHDWYAGLDGFGRMFRRRRGHIDRASTVVSTEEEKLENNIGHFIEWIEAFRVGRFVAKRPALPLLGYSPAQSASYFALRLAPALDLWGPDRQLRALDVDQRAFFAEAASEDPPHGIVLCLADPVQAFLEPNAGGVEILRALDLSIDGDGLLVLTGDTHQYCREAFGRGIHVTAGGGGAFLHPARIIRRGLRDPVAEFPGPRASLALALQVPWQIVHGRSGFLVHICMALLYLPTYGLQLAAGNASPSSGAITAIVVGVICLLLGGWRSGKAIIVSLLAAASGLVIGLLPVATYALVGWAVAWLHIGLSPHWWSLIAILLAVYGGTLAFGTYLMVLTILGLEQHQAFGALAHPGYKHFVRLRVRRDGSAVDAWVLGKVDPLRKRQSVVLVDRFTWKNPRSGR